MYFDYDEDQNEFRAVLRQLFTQHASIERVRAIAETGRIDRELWAVLCTEMAAPALHLSEDVGGAGFTLVETSILAQELGRTLAPVPLIATSVVTEAIIQLGTTQQVEAELGSILAGERIATAPMVALTNASTLAQVNADGTLSGSFDFIPHIADADVVLIGAALRDGGTGVYLVDPTDAGVTLDAGESLDTTRAGAPVRFESTRGVLLGNAQASPDRLARIDAIGRTLLAADLVGAAREALHGAVEYAKIRRQFNRQIGSFQGVKHLCSDASIAIELAHPVTDWAAMSYGTADFATHSVLAKYEASEALTLAAGNSIQVHGGMGFTWEATPHLYFRRATAAAQAYGDANANLLAIYQAAAQAA
ncbi:alkylation response protein AidB-like acyl-CoA dehydrogenase [Leucobacter exalbidus]|uniref:Alkylation response protein AidB-like acyl-CoA dehydrogenase n=1 Tax=Leucobacter exalbidus TaxID=662960 RepID=A0A940PXQ8_9MICO|nr:acyl-CoA dehydrogenase family protein [Leucobacter exalbidus]MBP1327294.1 alkylation response protein AidB-like acyl-CoA dehydrogenase [Leucobacter exalbidus]